MCGRFVSASERSRIEQQFSAVAVAGQEALRPDFNVAPSKKVYSIMDRHDERQLRVVTWGLIPSWAKDPAIGNRLVNARLESAAEKPSFRRAFARRRALIPADGYFEWYAGSVDSGSADSKPARPKKQPFYIHPGDGSLMAMAGLYEIWRDREIPDEDAPGAFRWTCTVLTTSATDDLGRIHDRMPLLVPAEFHDGWLDPDVVAPPSGALVPASPGLLQAYPVSTLVNSVRNNGPQLLDPLPTDG
ncbi:MAG: SOS response-associated peptidase [Actinomycetes bacterium]